MRALASITSRRETWSKLWALTHFLEDEGLGYCCLQIVGQGLSMAENSCVYIYGFEIDCV